MTRTQTFELNARTKAGVVRGTLSVSLEGPPDGLAAVDRALTAHLLAAPCEVTPAEVPQDEWAWESVSASTEARCE